MLFANYTFENSTELHYSIAEGIITIQCSLLCRHSSIFEQKPVISPPVRVPVPLLQPLTYDILQCLIIGIMVSLQTFFSKVQAGHI
jgi:hypothetical protein